jgi:predicted PurR-regulated permease PerM
MSQPARRGSPSSEGDPVELVLPTRAIVALLVAGLATIAAARMVDQLSEVIYLVALAVTLACLLLPGVERLSRRLPHALAVAVLFLGTLAVLIAVVAGGAHDLADQADAAAKLLTHRFQTLDPASLLGRFVEQSEISRRTSSFMNRLPSEVVFGVSRPADAPRRIGQAVVVGVLTLFALGSGPRIVRAGLDRVANPRRRSFVWQTLTSALHDSAILVNRSLAMAAACGVVAGGAAYGLGATGAVALGVWAGLCSVVPVLGVWVGFAPLVVLAGMEDTWRGGLALVLTVAVACAVRLLRRRWMDRETHIGPLLTVLAIASGVRLAGPIGCVPVLFLTAVAACVVRASGRGGLARPAAALDDFSQGVTDRSEEAPTARAPLWRTSRPDMAGQLPVTISWRSIGVLAVLVVLVAATASVLHHLPSVAIWTTLGLALALAVNPAVNRADRWLPGGRSVTLSALGAVAATVVGALLVAGVPALVDAVRSLPSELPDTAARLARLPFVDRVLDPGSARSAAQRFIDGLPERLGGHGSPAASLAAQAGDTLFGTLWTLLIAVTALLDGHRLLGAARRSLPAPYRDPAERVADLAYRSFGRYAAGSALVALLNGTVVTVIALALGIPVAPLLGLWAMLWNFVPQIGGLVGGAPLVLLGFTRSPLSGVIAFAAFIAYQNVENHLIQPMVVGKAVRLSPFTIMICVLGGGAVGGVIGAVLATPLVGALKTILCDVLPAPTPGVTRAPRAEASTDPEPTVEQRPPDDDVEHPAPPRPLSSPVRDHSSGQPGNEHLDDTGHAPAAPDGTAPRGTGPGDAGTGRGASDRGAPDGGAPDRAAPEPEAIPAGWHQGRPDRGSPQSGS